jgi:hypothetical protein
MDVMTHEEIHAALRSMEDDPMFMTADVYSARAVQLGTTQSFAEAHQNYLIAHPNVSPRLYIANLRMRVKKRS